MSQATPNNTHPFVLASGRAPAFQPRTQPPVTWWQQYQLGLQGNYGWPCRVTANGLAELDATTDSVLSKLPAIGSTTGWQQLPEPFLHKSVVAGSVQSGKTRSMIGLAAKAFDRGYRVVVVLSGLKNDLRMQTAKRFHADLLQFGEPILDSTGNVIGHTHPNGLGIKGSRGDFYALPFDEDAHQRNNLLLDVQRHLQLGDSILLVVKKHYAALDRVRDVMHHVWLHAGINPLPLFVIDDECDEASVPGRAGAPTPRNIVGIWTTRPASTPVAYVGYTATLQANIFQDVSNDLYPQNATVMRSPSNRTTSISYPESGHPDDWYTGSDVFYEWLQCLGLPNHFVRDRITQQQEIDGDPGWTWRGSELEQAIVAYFVSGAIRLLVAGTKIGVSPFNAPAHSMLVHTHGGLAEHRNLALIVCRLCNATPVSSAWYQQQGPRGRIDPVAMMSWLANSPADWKFWYDEFHQCFMSLQTLYAQQFRPWAFPTWQAVQNELRSHVFHNVQLKIVNSDLQADSLDFAKYTLNGQVQQPTDEFTIVVGGNILSRGITLEGLSVSYFTRRPQDPVDDTTCQRQRWFGYRGRHIEFCRLFTTPTVHQELRRAGHADVEALHQLANITAAGITDFKSYYQRAYGAGARPTSKPGAGQQPRLHYTGSWPANTHVHCATNPPNSSCPIAISNRAVAAGLASRAASTGVPIVTAGGARTGHLVSGLTALDVADMLDSLLFVDHNPRAANPLCQRFEAIAAVYGGTPQPLHRPPHTLAPLTDRVIPDEHDPYLIAAYLRAWHYMYVAIQRGAINRASELTAQGLRPWRPLPAPFFNLVFRHGSVPPNTGSPFATLGANLPARSFTTPRQVNALWGGSPGSRDEWLDQPLHPCANPVKPRPHGTDGLLMLYVLHPAGHPADQSCEYPTFAINIPEGGPYLRATVCG